MLLIAGIAATVFCIAENPTASILINVNQVNARSFVSHKKGIIMKYSKPNTRWWWRFCWALHRLFSSRTPIAMKSSRPPAACPTCLEVSERIRPTGSVRLPRLQSQTCVRSEVWQLRKQRQGHHSRRSRQATLGHHVRGTWFLAKLPAGNYQIVATFAGKAEKRTITVGAEKLKTVDFRWGSD